MLHVIASVAAVRGGPSQAVLELAAALQPLGVEVEIATTNDSGADSLAVPLGELMRFEGAPVRFFPRTRFPLRPLRDFAFSPALSHWLSRSLANYDLLHVHALFSHPTGAAMRLARRRGVPYLVRPSGLLCRWSLRQSSARKKLFLALFDRANLEGSAGIEFTAEQEREETGDLGLRAPSFVLPYGVHLPPRLPDAAARLRARHEITAPGPVLLFLSRLHHKKGAHHLIAALAGMKELPFTLLVAGSGDSAYEEQLRRQVGEAGLDPRVRFVGFARGEHKDLLLQGSDLFILPSHSESFGIAVMEALAAGTPVVTTPDVPVATVITQFELGWISSVAVEELRGRLREVLARLGDTAANEARSQRTRRLVEGNFTWERVAANMKQVYADVLARRPIRSFELRHAALDIT